MSILDEIVAHKRREVRERKSCIPMTALERKIQSAPSPKGFVNTVTDISRSGPAIIAEFKRGSPSLGCIREDLDPDVQSDSYQSGGAAAISVLTDSRYFFAKDDDLPRIRSRVDLPILRKEFMIDAYQVYESRAMGADCILLIMSVLSDREAVALANLAVQLGMDVLAEAHTIDELKRIQDSFNDVLIGVNNRNLKTFETSYKHILDIIGDFSDRSSIVAESGIQEPEAIRFLWDEEICIFLVGEALVTSSKPALLLQQLIGAVTE